MGALPDNRPSDELRKVSVHARPSIVELQVNRPRPNSSPKSRVLPGFSISLGLTTVYLSLIVLIPLAALFLKSATLDWQHFWSLISAPRVIASYKLTFGTAFVAASINTLFGFILAWVLARYDFTGKQFLDAVIDLPFALPTAVAGIALTSLYADNGWIGRHLATWSIHLAFTPSGIVIALMFVTLPFIVRSVQPVLQNLDVEFEDAASSLGASGWQIFSRVIFPAVLPALLTGFGLSLARAIGEYGSVVFISGNMPMRTEITSLLIITKLEQYDYAGATALAVVMLVISFSLLLAVNWLQRRTRRFQEQSS